MNQSSSIVAIGLALMAGQIQQSQPSSTSNPAKRAASQDSAKSDRFEELLRQLASKLRRKGAPQSVDAFDARAKINNPSEDKDVDLDARIIYEGRRGQKKLRVEITEGKKTILRVKNGPRYWAQQSEKPYRLMGKTYKKDRGNVRRDFTLAKLTARFLYPDRALRKLTNVEGPRATKLRIRRKTIDVLRVRGYAKDNSDFPLARSPDHKGRVRVTIWLDKTSLEPLRLEIVPMREKAGRQELISAMAETLKFSMHKWVNGLRLPGQITVWHFNEQGKLTKRSGIQIHGFRCNPAIDPKRFEMN